MDTLHTNGKHTGDVDRDRLVEGWLPLAQEASRQYGWELETRELEALIVEAAPALKRSRTALEARLCFWATYQRQHTSECS